MTGPSTERLFYEPGASWAWLLAGPAAGGAMLAIQISAGYGLQPLVPGLFLVLVSGFLAIQVKAARIHTSVELTPETLRQGAEITKVSEIVTVFPPPSGSEMQKWQSARALGELTGVPRGRTGIGLKLSGGRTAQAWARRHATLREELTRLVEERVP
ncbi:hypothetical protein AU195_05770 [Mycobacterium sp. IS-1496]|uniref:hypothetical protein n=1 Tax=Mycobacterium sp. IS-1496 TaxID=1772284 RepID=UPI0007416FBA|nr:hypothetical protein [Mycobacterium sp. IS-1496]KUI36295.1 hypothetical protein AU195_05770 [Mycobacterium sp. IS-1496]